jgi:dUTP pyrophosphatase
MKFTKVRNVKDPNRAHPGDAGVDFFIPEFDDEFLIDLRLKNQSHRYHIFWDKTHYDRSEDNFERVVVIPPHERLLIPSGIHVKLPPGHKLQAANKSGIANHYGVDKMAELVDESYQGEVHISIVNTSNNIMVIRGGMKIIQFVLTEYNPTPWLMVKSLEHLYPNKTSRAEGGFGSTGN